MLTISLNEIKTLNSEALCSLIVLLRSFNKNEFEKTSQIMFELSKRRECGDNFNFEKRIIEIEKEFKDINSQYIFSLEQVE